MDPHALDFDIMGHGSSRKAAVTMLNEALAETVLFRLQHNLPPIELAPAPEEVWKLAFKAGLAKGSAQPLKKCEGKRRTPRAAQEANRGQRHAASLLPCLLGCAHSAKP